MSIIETGVKVLHCTHLQVYIACFISSSFSRCIFVRSTRLNSLLQRLRFALQISDGLILASESLLQTSDHFLFDHFQLLNVALSGLALLTVGICHRCMVLRSHMVVCIAVLSLICYALVLLVVHIRSIELLQMLIVQFFVVKTLIGRLKVGFKLFATVRIVIYNTATSHSDVEFGSFFALFVHRFLRGDSVLFSISHCIFMSYVVFYTTSSIISQIRMFVCDFDLLIQPLFFVVKFTHAILNHLLLQFILGK